jgi:hypothetical protein
MRRARGNGGRFLNTKKIDNDTPNGKAVPMKGNTSVSISYDINTMNLIERRHYYVKDIGVVLDYGSNCRILVLF